MGLGILGNDNDDDSGTCCCVMIVRAAEIGAVDDFDNVQAATVTTTAVVVFFVVVVVVVVRNRGDPIATIMTAIYAITTTTFPEPRLRPRPSSRCGFFLLVVLDISINVQQVRHFCRRQNNPSSSPAACGWLDITIMVLIKCQINTNFYDTMVSDARTLLWRDSRG